MNESDERTVELDRLNLVGKAAFFGGTAVRLAAGFIDTAIHQAAAVYVEAEKAFKQGMDPNIEDAKVIGETERGSDTTNQ